MVKIARVFWDRVDEILSSQRRDHQYLRSTVQRNKNTYTSWFKRRSLSRIKDLEDIAAALGVAPAELLISEEDGPYKRTQQLELPFQPGTHSAKFEVEYTDNLLIFKSL